MSKNASDCLRLSYPWKRASLLAYLREMADVDYQESTWGKEIGVQWGGVYANIEFFLNEEELHKSASDAVGLYLLDDEASLVEVFAKQFSTVVDDLEDMYDSDMARASEGWPAVVQSAKNALDRLISNNCIYGIGSQDKSGGAAGA